MSSLRSEYVEAQSLRGRSRLAHILLFGLIVTTVGCSMAPASSELGQGDRVSKESSSLTDGVLAKFKSPEFERQLAGQGQRRRENRTVWRDDIRGGDFSGHDFSGFEFVGVDLVDVDFSEANFERAKFSGESFINARLQFANFSSAEIAAVDFTESDLRSACFANARIVGSDFLRSDMSASLLVGAKMINNTFTETEQANIVRNGPADCPKSN